MRITVLDVENSWTVRKNGQRDPSPYPATNALVSVGYRTYEVTPSSMQQVDEAYGFFHHKSTILELTDIRAACLQGVLDNTDLLIGHNLKYDLIWLLESGFQYEGKLYCTMVGEYVLARGMRIGLSLADCAIRRSLPLKKGELIDKYMADGVGFDEIPMEIVEEYGRGDVNTTAELFRAQCLEYAKDKNRSLVKVRDMMNEFIYVLSDMERNGLHIDLAALDLIEKEFTEELETIDRELQGAVAHYMGATPINLNSTEQLSWVIYSRKVIDKTLWADTFNIGMENRGGTLKAKRRPRMGDAKFYSNVRANTNILYKTSVHQCEVCKGTGLAEKLKKDGSPFKRFPKCKNCLGQGFIYKNLPQIAGLKIVPKDVNSVGADGFSTDKETLEYLILETSDPYKKKFLTNLIRRNAVTTYLDTFVEGIRTYTNADGILHPQFMQCVTRTGRLSCRNPNFQNQPRNRTFPVRRCINSRFDGGSILEYDFKGLEYRTAVVLAKDEVGIRDILSGVDPHAFTARHVGCDRQSAKSHTFAPLYGATSFGKPKAIGNYYDAFMEKHKGIAEWQGRLQDEAITFKRIRLPSGREYAFPDAKRTANGGSTYGTHIKNYPVQGFATADLVPLAGILLRERLKVEKVNSLLILTVHDSFLLDVYPGEEELVKRLAREALVSVKEELMVRFGFDFFLPIEVDGKAGPDWYNMEDV